MIGPGRYLVLAGMHIEASGVYKSAKLKNPVAFKAEEIDFRDGDIVDSVSDLSKFNCGPGNEKFEWVGPGIHTPKKSKDLILKSEELSRMNVDQLRKIAEEEEIDLGDSLKKVDIIQRIKKAQTLQTV